MPHAPSAVLDANVLFPFQLRDLLLHLAAEEQFHPLWSDEIVADFLRALQRDAGLTEAQCAHLSSQMRKYFPHAWRDGYAGAADGIVLADEGDRHVIALAVHHKAKFIVTPQPPPLPGRRPASARRRARRSGDVHRDPLRRQPSGGSSRRRAAPRLAPEASARTRRLPRIPVQPRRAAPYRGPAAGRRLPRRRSADRARRLTATRSPADRCPRGRRRG